MIAANGADDHRSDHIGCHTPDSITPDYFDDRMAVDPAPTVAAKAVHPPMKALGGGSIINVTSITWTVADGDCVCYVASKAAVHGMTGRSRPDGS